jgi:threonine/homoserine/homoserine lactone efflux protein
VGLVTGLGAATADMCYGAVAAFGLAAVSDLLLTQQAWVRLLGGLFLLYLGLRTFLAQPAEVSAEAGARGGLLGAYLSTFFLTLTNPATIISFAAIFAGLGLAGARSGYAAAGLLVVGVALGSALWWFVLSSGVSLLRGKLTPARLAWVNRLSGVILCGFGALALVSLLM